jgi:hypothetical protein
MSGTPCVTGRSTVAVGGDGDGERVARRERELAAVVAAFTGRGSIVVAIPGAGGVGKSALAVQAAHRLAHRFPDGHLYVDLQGAANGVRPLAREVLGRFLRALGARDADLPTTAEAAAAFRARVQARGTATHSPIWRKGWRGTPRSATGRARPRAGTGWARCTTASARRTSAWARRPRR